MLHIIKYSFKRLLKQPSMIFWVLIFPIILATLFKLAFSNLKETTMEEKIKVLVEENLKNKIYTNSYLDIDYINKDNEEEINNKLLNDDYIAYLYLDNSEIKIKVSSSGIKQTIFIEILNSYVQQINSGKEFTNSFKITDESSNNFDVIDSYFFSLLGMLCMFGGFYGVDIVNSTMPNLSKLGARINVSPTKKVKYLIGNTIVSYLVFLLIELIVILYMHFVLNINFGDFASVLKLILLIMVGSIVGITFGMIVSTIKASEAAKIGIINAITLSLSAFAGLYAANIKYFADTKLPFINKINPTNLINDSLLAINYFHDDSRFYVNIFTLSILSIIFIFVTILILRRRKYANI